MSAVDESIFRSVLGRFATGVTVVTARDEEGRDHGMTVSAFSSVSLAPPLVMTCIGHDASMHGVLMTAERIGINILDSAQEALSRRFAEQDSDRFEGIGFARAESGVALLLDALAHLECRVVSRQETGDHTLIVAEVERARPNEGKPLLYYRGGYAQLER
ncbi:MAG: flavin reductase domain protein FMN-binding protein [Gemmatimonadetes bacterium]|nr:flavin reductase domain protein FMN-binding protein [Gemmatimonadota bacterium]